MPVCGLMVPLSVFTWNAVVFLLYGADKRKAQKKKHRISEKTLISCAFLMGGFGALFGMLVPYAAVTAIKNKKFGRRKVLSDNIPKRINGEAWVAGTARFGIPA